MKLLKKLLLATLITLVALVVAPKIVPEWQNTVEAASVKISSKKKTMYKGYTYTLKVTGTKKKVTWTSSDKSKATVNSKGKVYAKKNGKVTITAKVGNKKYTCKVTIKNKPYKLKQFSTTFYNLKDVAKEYRICENIKNYKDFIYDLDGDGKKDKITIRHIGKDWNNEERYQIEFNGKAFLDTQEDVDYITEVCIVDLNKNDKKLELVIHELGPNDMEKYIIYSKNGSKIKKVNYVYGWNLRIDQKGKMLTTNPLLEAISPQVYDKYYQYSNKKVTTKKLNLKNIKNVKFKTKYKMLFTSSMKNLDKFFNYGNLEYKKALKKAGIYEGKYTSFNILKITDTDEAYVKLKNGKKGYIFSVAYHLAG